MDGKSGDAENSTDGDCVFHVGGGRCKLIVEENKDFLAAKSAVFERMFKGDFSQESPVEITDVEPEAFLITLKFLHDEPYHFSSKEIAIEVMHVAEKYALTDLKQKCEEFLLPKCIDDVWFVADCAYQYNSTTLQKAIRDLLSKDTSAIIRNDIFLDAREELVLDVVQLESVTNVTELHIFKAVIKWAKHQLKKEGNSSNNADLLLEKLKKFLQFIRLPTMSAEDRSEVKKILKFNAGVEEDVEQMLGKIAIKRIENGYCKNIYPTLQVIVDVYQSSIICFKPNTLKEQMSFTERAHLISIIVPSKISSGDSLSYYWEDLQVLVKCSRFGTNNGAIYGCGYFKGFVSVGKPIDIPIIRSSQISDALFQSYDLTYFITINFSSNNLYPWQSVRKFPNCNMGKDNSSGFIIGYKISFF